MATATVTKRKVKRTAAPKTARKDPGTKGVKKSEHKDYDDYKVYKGKQYTGMQIGRSHKWNYDSGVWRETKVTPDQWDISYSVTKRRAGHAPKGSGAAVGTGYHWFILSHQYVEKLNDDDYSTTMVGMKFKLAHKRASKNTWSASDKAQRYLLVKILKDVIKEIEKDPESTVPVPLKFEYRGKQYEGVGIPVMSSCENDICMQLDITLNKEHLGVLKCLKNGWSITGVKPGLAKAIGNIVEDYYDKE